MNYEDGPDFHGSVSELSRTSRENLSSISRLQHQINNRKGEQKTKSKFHSRSCRRITIRIIRWRDERNTAAYSVKTRARVAALTRTEIGSSLKRLGFLK
ncbi:unnamed protein product [Rhodiola kirilowii]